MSKEFYDKVDTLVKINNYVFLTINKRSQPFCPRVPIDVAQIDRDLATLYRILVYFLELIHVLTHFVVNTSTEMVIASSISRILVRSGSYYTEYSSLSVLIFLLNF